MIQLVVEDTGDTDWDSAVFIKGGSFGGEEPDDDPGVVPLPASLPLMLAGLAGLGIMRRRNRAS